jgi:hypothetical protein
MLSGNPDRKSDVFQAGIEICAGNAIHRKNCTMLEYIASRQCNIFLAVGVVKCNLLQRSND